MFIFYTFQVGAAGTTQGSLCCHSRNYLAGIYIKISDNCQLTDFGRQSPALDGNNIFCETSYYFNLYYPVFQSKFLISCIFGFSRTISNLTNKKKYSNPDDRTNNHRLDALMRNNIIENGEQRKQHQYVAASNQT